MQIEDQFLFRVSVELRKVKLSAGLEDRKVRGNGKLWENQGERVKLMKIRSEMKMSHWKG